MWSEKGWFRCQGYLALVNIDVLFSMTQNFSWIEAGDLVPFFSCFLLMIPNLLGETDIFHQWIMTCLEGLEILRSNEGLVLVMPAFPGVEHRNAHRIRTLG